MHAHPLIKVHGRAGAWLLLALLGALALPARGAVAQFSSAALSSERAGARVSEAALRLEDTAYTLPSGHFSVGLLSAEAGVTSIITVGTYLAGWLAFPLMDAPIATGFVKVKLPSLGALDFAVRSGFSYVDATKFAEKLSDGRASRASVWALPAELSGSMRLGEHLTQSLALHYVYAHVNARDAKGSGSTGSLHSSETSASALLEARLNPWLALTLVGRVGLYQEAARIHADVHEGSTEVHADLGFQPYAKRPWCIVPGVAFTFANLHVELGVGYGSYWLPMVQAPLPGRSIIPEGNVYWRF